MAHFVPNFVALATGINQADPENHTVELKITTLYYT